jgi:type I restriction enzyme S subunit
MATKSGSVDPSKFTDEIFDLYSIPAFDRGEPEIVAGSAIGSAKQVVEPGDVLLSRIVPHIRRSWVVDKDHGRRIIASGEWIVFRSENANPDYLRHVLVGDPFHAQFMNTVAGVGGSLLRARPAHVAKIVIPLPPLAEQRRIAEVLDRAEALRAKRRAALAQLDSLTQSLFLDLFGDPRPNEKSWPLRSLKELGKVKTGGTPPSAKPGMFGGPIPFVTPGDLESEQPVKRSVTEAGAVEAETVRAGATLVCCIGATIGKMGKATQHSAFNQQINAVEWANGVDDNYGLGVLRFFKPQIATWGASTTLPILKKSSFEKIEIPVPPLPLQREFARRVTAVEKLKTAQRASQAELDALFATLQHRAFRGEL